MTNDPPTRRDFLKVSSAAVAGLAALAPPRAARTGPTTTRVRRNWGKLDPSKPGDKKVLDQYAQAVGILRKRSEDDPRGWQVQAGLHSYRCQHGNWWFLPWHRMYLYYFELILQDALGDTDFALPYWDWTDGNQLALPTAFRDPTSKLYDDRRRGEVNDGSASLDWSFYDQYYGGVLNYVVNLPDFVPSFGSPQADSFPGLEQTHGPEYEHGDFEGGPHDTVHSWTAGNQQPDMGLPAYAALDPIFWLHHANIDRLWNRWRKDSGHLNPTSNTWQKQPFAFYGSDGQPARLTVEQVLDTHADPLRYRYDDE